MDKLEIFHVLHDKVAVLTRRCSKWGTKICQQRILEGRDHICIYTKCWSKYEFFDYSDEIEIRLSFYRSFSQFGIDLMAVVLKIFIYGHG